MDTWEKETIIKIVDAFLDERFPTVIVSGYGFDLFVRVTPEEIFAKADELYYVPLN